MSGPGFFLSPGVEGWVMGTPRGGGGGGYPRDPRGAGTRPDNPSGSQKEARVPCRRGGRIPPSRALAGLTADLDPRCSH